MLNTFTPTNVLEDQFTLRYAVYHHLRSQHWVVRDGIKYGADFGKSISLYTNM
jgi:tRNA splicing endonuclease